MKANQARHALLDALRKVLKNRKLTYKQVAGRLGVTEQTVKRMFSGDGDFPASRLFEICDAVDVDFFAVAASAEVKKEETFQLTVEQEQFFVDHPGHLVFFEELRAQKSPAEIRAAAGISVRSTQKYLRDLESVGVLERLPKDAVKLKVRGAHNWLQHGPLGRAHSRRSFMQMFDFLETRADRDLGENLMTSTETDGATHGTLKDMVRELKELAGRYRVICQRDAKLRRPDELVKARWALCVASPFRPTTEAQIVDLT